GKIVFENAPHFAGDRPAEWCQEAWWQAGATEPELDRHLCAIAVRLEHEHGVDSDAAFVVRNRVRPVSFEGRDLHVRSVDAAGDAPTLPPARAEAERTDREHLDADDAGDVRCRVFDGRKHVEDALEGRAHPA